MAAEQKYACACNSCVNRARTGDTTPLAWTSFTEAMPAAREYVWFQYANGHHTFGFVLENATPESLAEFGYVAWRKMKR